MADYRALLDTEVWAFLDKTERYYPSDGVDLIVAEQRMVYNKICAAFDQGRPSDIMTDDFSIGGVPCRVYVHANSPLGTVFFCHGCGFVVGDLDSHDSICAEFCSTTGLHVVAVDSRLSPEHPHPEDFNDAWAAFEAVCTSYQGSIVMCGDSAGGNLVAAVTHYARGRIDGRISGQLLIYPGLGGDHSKGSYITHSDSSGLTTRDIEFYMNIRSAGRTRQVIQPMHRFTIQISQTYPPQ